MSAATNLPPQNQRISIIEGLRLQKFISDGHYSLFLNLINTSGVDLNALQKLIKEFENLTEFQNSVPRYEVEAIDLDDQQNIEILKMYFKSYPPLINFIPDHIKQSIIWFHQRVGDNSTAHYKNAILNIVPTYYQLAKVFGFKFLEG